VGCIREAGYGNRDVADGIGGHDTAAEALRETALIAAAIVVITAATTDYRLKLLAT
jgi:hypothetical protein